MSAFKASAGPAGPQPAEAQSGGILLQAVPQRNRTNLAFEGVDAYVPVVAGGNSPNPVATLSKVFSKERAGDEEQGAAKGEKQILFGVKGRVEPGEMLALMGPSGSGKSSLLSVLGGRSTARVTGTIHFNGRAMDKKMKRRLAFVPQDDLLFAELTTFETLYYAAMLRLPREWSKEKKIERVERVIAGLGLIKARDTIIGGGMVRGVSGGERKRVSIGHELLTNPSVIFLDEPTSGLDSTTALTLIHTLHGLANGGRTIIASIHQPSSRLYQEFDKLMLLANGYTMYYGEAQAAAHWFAQQHLPVPFGVSMPDHLLDLANGDVKDRCASESAAIQKRLVTAWQQRSIGLGVHGVQPSDFPGLVTLRTRSSVAQSQTSIEAATALYAAEMRVNSTDKALEGTNGNLETGAVKMESIKDGEVVVHVDTRTEDSQPADAELDQDQKWSTTWLDQVRILTARSIRTRAGAAFSWQKITELLLPAILAGLFWLWKGGAGSLSKTNVQNLSGLLFFEIIYMSFNPMFQALFTFPTQVALLTKERQSGMYRLSAYYIARTISDLPMDCLLPTVFAWILFWFTGLRIQAGAFFLNWFVLVLNVLVAQSYGLIISAGFTNPNTILTVATVAMLIMMLVSGFFVTNIHVWISWLKYISFVYYSYNLMLISVFKGRGYDCSDYYRDHPDAPPGKEWCEIADAGVLPININASIHPALDACMLIFFLILFRIITYVVLNAKTKFKVQ